MFFNEDMINEEVNNDITVDETVLMETLIQESGEMLTEDEMFALYECGLLTEASIVRLDKEAHKNRAKKKVAIQLAKEDNDKNYRKLVAVYKLKAKLIDNIMKKYGQKAEAEVRKFKFTAKGRVNNKPENVKAAKAIKKVLDAGSIKKTKDIE